VEICPCRVDIVGYEQFPGKGSSLRMERAISGLPAGCIILMSASLLAFQPGGLFRFVWVKLVVVILAVLAGLLSPGGARLPLAVKAVTAACVLWIAVAMLLSDTPLVSVAGRWPRYEGLLTLAVYVAVFAVGAKVLGGSGGSRRRALLSLSLAVAGIALFIIAGLESAGLRPLGGAEDVRPGATLGNATDQGLVGVVIAGALAAQGDSDKAWQVWLRRVGLLAGAGVAILSGSRAALAALLIVALFSACAWMNGRSWSPVKIAAGAAVAAAALGVVVLLVPSARNRLLTAGTVDGRWLLWDRSRGLIADHSVSGVGPSGFVDAFPEYLNGEWARTVGDSFPADSPHSWPLQALAAGGVPLLALVLALITVSLLAVVRRLRATSTTADRTYLAMVLVTVGAYALALLTHFTSIGTTGMVAFLCGGLVGTDGGKLASVRASFIAVLGAGARAAAAGDSTGAQLAFVQARQLRPWDSDTAMLAAQAFAGPATAGNQEAARRAVEWGRLARERTPGSQEAGTALALGYLYSGDVPAAKDLLDALVAEAPYSTTLYVHRGVAQFGMGRSSEAIADLEHAASLDPSLDTPWRVLANIYQRLGNVQESLAASRHADSLHGN
jgi:Flp pilus assembly protein TadD/O-antigen ligase